MAENIETTIVDGKKHDRIHVPPCEINISSFQPLNDKGNIKWYLRTISYGGGMVRGKPEIVVQEDYALNDRDETEKEVMQLYICHRQEERTNIFQIIRYKIGIIKHVDCKTNNCENQWKYTDTGLLSEKFDFNDSDGYKIRCLLCGATCDTYMYHSLIRVLDASSSFVTE